MLREYGLEPVYRTTDQDTIYSLLRKRAEEDSQDIIAQWEDSSRNWHEVSAHEMLEDVRRSARGLMALGVKKGDMVVIYSATCYSWGVMDFACAAIGAVSVPIYETDSEAQAASIIEQVQPVVAFAGDEAHAQTLERIRATQDSFKLVFNFANNAIEALSDMAEPVSEQALDEAIGQVHADDLLTIVFTSGSTGKPKGAMLSHRNFTHIIYAGYAVLPEMIYEPSRLLLFLPLAHCFARYIQYVSIGAHGVLGYVPGAKHLLADLRTFQPTYLLGVPRVFEKVYNAASQKAGAGIKGHLFVNGFNHFVQWSIMMNNHERPTRSMAIKHKFYMGTVGASIRSALGPNMKYLACGGAPINPDLVHFFNGMDGLTFIQGYGMTETAAPMIVNWQDANRAGSVGRPGPGISVRTADDGELLAKGPSVFLGYYKNPEMTAETIDKDGWLHTGDLAKIDDEGFVYITGRKKDIIITAGGKNVTPIPMENIVKTCPIVSHAVVVGDNKPFIAALVTLDPEAIESWKEQQHIEGDISLEDVAESDAARSLVQQYVDKANSTVSRAESIRKFVILPHDFSLEDGTMTPSMKVVRPKVLAKYEQIIEGELYAPKPSTMPVPVSVQIIERTSESMKTASKNMKIASENVNRIAAEKVTPAVKHALDSVHDRVDRIKRKDGEDDETASADVPTTVDDVQSANPEE